MHLRELYTFYVFRTDFSKSADNSVNDQYVTLLTEENATKTDVYSEALYVDDLLFISLSKILCNSSNNLKLSTRMGILVLDCLLTNK